MLPCKTGLFLQICHSHSHDVIPIPTPIPTSSPKPFPCTHLKRSRRECKSNHHVVVCRMNTGWWSITIRSHAIPHSSTAVQKASTGCHTRVTLKCPSTARDRSLFVLRDIIFICLNSESCIICMHYHYMGVARIFRGWCPVVGLRRHAYRK